MIKSTRLTGYKMAVYLLIFFVVWSVRELIIQPVFLSPLENVFSELIGEAIKLLVWTLPAVLLIRRFCDDMWVGFKEMFLTRPRWFSDAPLLLLVFVPVLQAFLHSRALVIDPGLDLTRLIGGVVFVGVTEEIVFRGFLLNAFLKKFEMKYAVALNEILFVLIHYPIWIYAGLGVRDILAGSVAVFAIGVFFSYSFIKTRNIFVPIVLHMAWNLFVIVLYN